MASPRAHEQHDPWVGALEGHTLRQLIGARTLELALASDAGYVEPPSLCAEGVIAAVEEKNVEGGARVILRGPDGTSLSGSCSRCTLAFGPCVHMGIVAVDLALSPRLRSALLESDRTHDAAEESPRIRRIMRLERNFENALSTWLVPARNAEEDAEISAAPLTESEVHMARGYSDRVTAAPTAAIAIFVRRRGERRLLTPREIISPDTFSARDRQVLAHARDRGAGKKSAFASGAEASIAIEAMRVHGGVFAAGYKGKLNFRASLVRPAIRVGPSATGSTMVPASAALAPEGFESLSAFWHTEDGTTSIPFTDATLFVGAFPFVWTSNGSIYRVARDVDLTVAQGFLRMPTLHVPKARLKDAGARLLHATRGRGITLPSHETFGLPPLEKPRIVLRLEGEPLAIAGNAFAIYRNAENTLFGPAPTAQEETGRDMDYEARALELLASAKLLPPPRGTSEESTLSESEDDLEEAEALSTSSTPITAAGERAVLFWQQGLAELKAARDPSIEVELSPKLARVRMGAPLTARVHVSLDGHWLRTKLDFRSEELPVELELVRTALLKKRRWIALDDGTLARISGSVAALTEEAGRVLGKGESESLLSPHQLGRLDRWIEDHDGRIDAAVISLRKKLRALAVSEEPEMPKKLEATLRPYQRRGLAWLQFLDALGAGGILADDMGLGKTITTLAYLLHKKQKSGAAPSLVVCPTSVATNWIREAARFTPQLRVALMHGPSREKLALEKYDVIVTTYAIMRLDIDALAKTKFRCVVLDEAQNIKNASSATTRAAYRLDANMRLALSGTPMENRLGELWSLASFANPGILGTLGDFETRYERPIVADRSTPLAAELRSVLRPFLLRRTKADVLPDLPPKTEIDRFVSLATPDKRMYDALALTLRESVQRDIENREGAPSISVFAALTRLRQMACDPRLVDKRVSAEHNAPGAKREAFLELVRELVAEGRRALVFSQFVSLLTLWRRDLDTENIAYEYLDGSTLRRDEAVTRFQEGNAPLFLISLKAGGAGLNLTAADTVIHCDPWWNPAVEDQATDRAHRIGQDKPVTVVRLVARGTIEEKILALKAKKRDLASAVIGDDAGALSGISMEDVKLLLGSVEDEASLEDDDLAAATDMIATVDRVVDPVYATIAKRVQRWSRETGRKESELATLLDIPHEFAARLVRGEPFPCTRLMGERIRTRIHEWK